MSGDFQRVILRLVDDIDLEASNVNRLSTPLDKEQPQRSISGVFTLFAVPKNICCAETPELPTV